MEKPKRTPTEQAMPGDRRFEVHRVVDEEPIEISTTARNARGS